MPLSAKVQKQAWGMFAARCAICRESVVHTSTEGKQSLLGEIAHIVGEKTAAARGKIQLSEDGRNDIENLMLVF